jgi:hypothetical protein
MPSREIRPGIVAAILAANNATHDPAGPNAVRQLDVDRHGQLWELTLGMHTYRGDGEANLLEFDSPADGYSVLADVETVHPVRDGRGPTVAEVLVQLSGQLRSETAGVQFLELVETFVNAARATRENGDRPGWAAYRTRLYRHLTPLTADVEEPFALPDGAFDATGAAHLIIYGVRYDGQWLLSAQVFRPHHGEPGEIIGKIVTEKAADPVAADDAIEAAQRWITEVLPAGITVAFFWNLTVVSYGPTGELGDRARARMMLRRRDRCEA